MSLREIKKQKTTDEFMEAIKRIVNQEPKCKELKKKLDEGKLLKLNATNVEKEAGKGYNSTRHHQVVLNEIERINGLECGVKRGGLQAIVSLKSERKEKNKEIKNLKNEIKSKNAEIEMLKSVNLSLHAHYRELTSALYDKIPQEEREELFEISTARCNNVDLSE